MSSLPTHRCTAAEYLAIERTSPVKHEFYGGEMFAMAGASREHNEIAVNLITWLRTQLRRSACRPYAGDMLLQVQAAGLYTYPDLMIACEPVEMAENTDSLLNPRVIIEILSASAEAYDRGWKFRQYLRIPTLEVYLLVSQTEPLIERFSRAPEGNWVWKDYAGREACCELPSLGLKVPLAEVYADVQLPPQSLQVRT